MNRIWAVSCLSDRQNVPAIREARISSRSNRKLLFLLFLFFVTLLVILFFHSSISRIETIHIKGYKYLSKEQILQASGLKPGDHFFFAGKRAIEQRIGNLSIVEAVKVNKNFPGVIEISIEEFPEAALVLSEGTPKVILSNGVTVDFKADGGLIHKPVLTGWSVDDPIRKELLRVLTEIPDHLLADISEILPAPSPSYADRIKIYTRSKFEVITTVSYLPEKIKILDDIIYVAREENMPVRIVMLEADTYAPYENPGR
jgi:cell division protein FtsQ